MKKFNLNYQVDLNLNGGSELTKPVFFETLKGAKDYLKEVLKECHQQNKGNVSKGYVIDKNNLIRESFIRFGDDRQLTRNQQVIGTMWI